MKKIMILALTAAMLSGTLCISASAEEKTDGSRMQFSTTDLEGSPVSMEDFSDAKLILVNFWEPWCGPCVKELPELQKISENYRDSGVIVLGVFQTVEMEEDAKAILEDAGVEYPILHFTEDLNAFVKDYVPSTVFTDGEGTVLGEVAGAMDYESWEKEVEGYLK